MRTSTRHHDSFAVDNLPPSDQLPTIDLGDLVYSERLNGARELLEGTISRVGGDRPCLRAGDGTVWSYTEVGARVNRLAHVLVEDLGLAPGNRVLLRGPNNPAFAVCLLAVLKAGGIAVPTMPLLRSKELRTIAAKAEVRLALCDSRYTGELADVRVETMRVVDFDGTGGGDGDAAADGELDRLAEGKPAQFQAADTAAEDIALIAFTSGTSGTPKATMHHHRDLLAVADTFSATVLRPRPEDVFTGSPPLAFTFGLGGLLLFPLRAGASTLLLERAAPNDLFGAIARHGVSVLFTAPTAYRAALSTLDNHELGTLRRCVSAGEALPARTWHAFHEATGLKIIDGIGSTEMLHIFLASADEDIRPGSTGRPVPGYQACVLDEHGAPVADGTPGRLAVRGPTGCRYLADERQREYVRDGWNITGDTYIRDGDGYFWYQARTDDMIVSSGYNIAAPEVEDVVLRHPDVAECAVVGTPDTERGAIVKAYVVPRAGVPAHAELARDIQDFVKSEIAPYKYPRAIEFVTQLPRTLSGKVQRALLPERAARSDTPSTADLLPIPAASPHH